MRRRAVVRVLVALAAVALVAGVAASGGSERAARAGDPPPPVTTPLPDAPAERLVLVRRRTGLPASWVARLRRSDAVRALVLAGRTQLLLRRSARGDGRVVDAPRAGLAIPLDALVVDPRAYARVTREDAVAGLRSGRVLLSQTSARLRRLGAGGRLAFSGGRTARVAGVVPDELARGAEVVVAAADVPRAERRATQVLLATRDPEAIDRLVPDDRLTRVGVLTADGAPAGGASIVRAVELKRRIGEFAVALPYGEDWIEIDPAWVRRTIVTREVPILGRVTCHRAMIAPLRRALTAVRRAGLQDTIDAGDYAGCWAARRIPGSGSLSLHAWGLAVDLNASANPPGPDSRQDPRLVAAFERAGFAWGGRWPTAPDPMHFELQRPAGAATSTSARPR